MKNNENLVLDGKNVILVPYRKEHVERYNEWMKSEELLELTDSEPLSLQEEYEMQESWKNDNDKCTFILLSKEPGTKSNAQNWRDLNRMVGDVNLYINDIYDKERAEIEVMIAEPEFRGKGIASEALKILMCYALKALGISKFYCRILEKNVQSIKLFSNLGYKITERSEYFKQVTLELEMTEDKRKELMEYLIHVKEYDYN
ncbi:hypothetical protein BB559_005062 [Furculomyces boomerangus]|uniref:N-acetyltransferase 9-like protein n=2 Tax=Harpellales TaxID=61421 RepID=A0A2T9YB72_9FUNG|nr:hypothetical protein BB559_005062 [Furculomyces boomerangus]PWA00087.1 hypothetical protein BB558_003902 [Smittium angustum]PWA02533.1 hypothetical protein BB558_001354 [Smittium angustum]